MVIRDFQRFVEMIRKLLLNFVLCIHLKKRHYNRLIVKKNIHKILFLS